MSFFCIGLVRGYSAPAIPSIRECDPELLPSKDIASWASNGDCFGTKRPRHRQNSFWCNPISFFCTGSIPPSGAFLGSILAGFLLQHVGRKNTIVISSPLATIGWILIATATRYEMVIFGRFITGFCVGLCLPSAQVYVNLVSNSTTKSVFHSKFK